MQGHSSLSLKNNEAGRAPNSGTVGNLQCLCSEVKRKQKVPCIKSIEGDTGSFRETAQEQSPPVCLSSFAQHSKGRDNSLLTGRRGLVKCWIIYSSSSYSHIKFKLYTEHNLMPGTSEELNMKKITRVQSHQNLQNNLRVKLFMCLTLNK